MYTPTIIIDILQKLNLYNIYHLIGTQKFNNFSDPTG